MFTLKNSFIEPFYNSIARSFFIAFIFSILRSVFSAIMCAY